MDVAVILIVAILTYAILIYNRMQKLWQTVREGLANVDMEVGVLADLTKRVTMRPGETLEVRMWRHGAEVRFRCVAAERDVTVLDNGVARLA